MAAAHALLKKIPYILIIRSSLNRDINILKLSIGFSFAFTNPAGISGSGKNPNIIIDARLINVELKKRTYG